MNVEDNIEALKLQVHEYRKALNDEGVWLFLATLGCWGVSQQLIQIVALGATLMLFANRFQARLGDREPISKVIAGIRLKIENELEDGDAKKPAFTTRC